MNSAHRLQVGEYENSRLRAGNLLNIGLLCAPSFYVWPPSKISLTWCCSRENCSSGGSGALAKHQKLTTLVAEGGSGFSKSIPSGAKALCTSLAATARLKSCPFKAVSITKLSPAVAKQSSSQNSVLPLQNSLRLQIQWSPCKAVSITKSSGALAKQSPL